MKLIHYLLIPAVSLAGYAPDAYTQPRVPSASQHEARRLGVIERSARTIHYLLDAGTNPDIHFGGGKYGTSILHMACRWANSSVMDRMIALGAKTDQALRFRDSDYAKFDYYSIPPIEGYLARFERVRFSVTALHTAASHCNAAAVSSLLIGGASILPDHEGQTAIHCAVRYRGGASARDTRQCHRIQRQRCRSS